MRAQLTKLENNLLMKLLKDFEEKVAKTKKLSDEQQLILTLSQKSMLSDADVKKLRLLLEFEKSKITIRDKKRKAKEALKLHEDEKKEIVENRYRRFGLVMIESLKKLPNQKATIALSDFLSMLLADNNLSEKDKDWLKNFLVDSSVPVEQFIESKVNEINHPSVNTSNLVSPLSDNFNLS
ncbi:hypothetical protein ACH0AB_10970 [Moraxella sp. 179-F 1C4 NHS]